MQGLFGCLPWGMILTYLNDYLAQNRGLSVQSATGMLLALGLGGGVGVMGGGFLGQWLYNRHKWAVSVFIGECVGGEGPGGGGGGVQGGVRGAKRLCRKATRAATPSLRRRLHAAGHGSPLLAHQR